MDKNIQVVVPENYDGKPITVQILEGSSVDPINPKPQSYIGDVNAVVEYVKRDFEKKDCIIIFDNEKKTVKLIVYPELPNSISVTGCLKETIELNSFGIEENKRLTLATLKQLVRINRMFFLSADHHQKLLKNLNDLDAKITKIIKDESDTRGNTAVALETKVISNVDEKFSLLIPVFAGLPKVSFEVNICMEARDAGLSFWLESPELLQLKREMWDKIVLDQTKDFTKLKITVINS